VERQKKIPDAKVVDDGVVTKRLWTSRVGHSITISDGKKGASVGDKTRFVEIKLGDKKTYAMISEAGVTIEAAKGKPSSLWLVMRRSPSMTRGRL
jgi:hypothetical protein